MVWPENGVTRGLESNASLPLEVTGYYSLISIMVTF